MRKVIYIVMACLGLVAILSACFAGFLGFTDKQTFGLVVAAMILFAPAFILGYL